ncbi:MAG TPA: hybrid sensor histidine kinase/response regulator [bacterium]|nr:hybrid sensor histidine kinase/response regulator [bacterium]HPQ19177.1 hybrid sensor histidine kinase/response regulator [bacterium]
MEKSKILVIDDDNVILLLLKKILELNNFEVVTFNNGKSAIEYLKKNNIDLILLDLMMPELDGYEICKIVKSTKKLRNIPIIIMTAKSDESEIEKAINNGANDFIRKPINRYELLTRIKNLIKIKKYEIILEKRNKELKRINQLKNDFLGVVAHDLKNPLSIINGYTQLLLMNETNLNQKYKNYLMKILYNTENMLYLINDLMDISLIESGKYKLFIDKNDIVKTIKDCIDSLSYLAKEKNIKINFQTNYNEFISNFDKKRIIQVINNILNNAVKFSDDDSEINIILDIDKKYIRIKIEDKGIGIPEKDFKKIFKRFTRGSHAIEKDIKGTGLGLSICKDIVDLHKGKILVKSKENEGSTFIVILPIK